MEKVVELLEYVKVYAETMMGQFMGGSNLFIENMLRTLMLFKIAKS